METDMNKIAFYAGYTSSLTKSLLYKKAVDDAVPAATATAVSNTDASANVAKTPDTSADTVKSISDNKKVPPAPVTKNWFQENGAAISQLGVPLLGAWLVNNIFDSKLLAGATAYFAWQAAKDMNLDLFNSSTIPASKAETDKNLASNASKIKNLDIKINSETDPTQKNNLLQARRDESDKRADIRRAEAARGFGITNLRGEDNVANTLGYLRSRTVYQGDNPKLPVSAVTKDTFKTDPSFQALKKYNPAMYHSMLDDSSLWGEGSTGGMELRPLDPAGWDDMVTNQADRGNFTSGGYNSSDDAGESIHKFVKQVPIAGPLAEYFRNYVSAPFTTLVSRKYMRPYEQPR